MLPSSALFMVDSFPLGIGKSFKKSLFEMINEFDVIQKC
jgi:hypothetical protein